MATRFPRTPTANMVAEMMSDLDSRRSGGDALWLWLSGRGDRNPEPLLCPKVSLIIFQQQRASLAAQELAEEILGIFGHGKTLFLPARTTHPGVLLLLSLLGVLIQIDPHEGVPGSVYAAR